MDDLAIVATGVLGALAVVVGALVFDTVQARRRRRPHPFRLGRNVYEVRVDPGEDDAVFRLAEEDPGGR